MAGRINLRKWHLNPTELLEKINFLPTGTNLNCNTTINKEMEEDNTYVKTSETIPRSDQDTRSLMELFSRCVHV